MLRALLTGSRVYGTAKADSDLDLVLLVDEEAFQTITETVRELEPSQEVMEFDYPNQTSLRLGKVNFILTTDPVAFAVWQKGTDILSSEAPVTRDTAVVLFKRLREEHGVSIKSKKIKGC